MASWMNYIGIWEDAINDAINTAEEALKQLELDYRIKKLHSDAAIELEYVGSWDHITNSIITAYFTAAQSIISDYLPDIETDFYVNCYDSHFYIGGDEV